MTIQEFQARRAALASRLPSDAIALIPAANEVLRNGDAHYRFRQDSDFYYLTGFSEPEALLIITGGNASEAILFNQPRSPLAEQWTGPRLGQEAACEILGVDCAYPITSLEELLPQFIAGKKSLYYALDKNPCWAKQILKAWQDVKGLVRRGTVAPEAFCDLGPLLGELRLIKSVNEIKLIERAVSISVKGHQRAMRAAKAAKNEYQLEAELLYEFYRGGCRSVAYDSIVAGGANACVLHYTDNNRPLQQGEMVLIDAGGEYENYAADITRTFPVSGQFSHEQELIYDLVLESQKRGIACIKPGTRWDEIQKVIVNCLTQGLVDLGLLKGSVEELIEREAYKPMYMHQSGHWLGLDVHDVGAYKIDGKWRVLEPMMVLTVEPGLYIKPGLEGVDSRFWGIGVRIEDDVQVIEGGSHVLSKELPSERAALEALMS